MSLKQRLRGKKSRRQKAEKEKRSEGGKPPRPWTMLPVLIVATVAWVAVAVLGLLDFPYPIAWIGAFVTACVAVMEAMHAGRLSKLEAEAKKGLFLVMDDSGVRAEEERTPPPAPVIGKMPLK